MSNPKLTDMLAANAKRNETNEARESIRMLHTAVERVARTNRVEAKALADLRRQAAAVEVSMQRAEAKAKPQTPKEEAIADAMENSEDEVVVAKTGTDE